MPLEDAFLQDCPYGPGGLLIDELLKIDKDESFVRARLQTHKDLPLTREQRTHPTRHPAHVSGGLMIHMTGMVAFAHAYYVLDMRHSEGWIGYGVRVHNARYHNLAPIGAPMILDCKANRIRELKGQRFIRYSFRFTQEEKLIYEGDQTAVWSRVDVKP